jgi:hypothetical protein
VPIGAQFGYVQYLGTHRQHGEAILVRPGARARQSSFGASFFADGYVTFFPAGVAVSQKRIEVVAQSPPPPLPKRFRRPGAAAGDGTVESWTIEGGWRDIVKQKLTDEDRALPIAQTWDLETLKARIASSWTPATDGALESIGAGPGNRENSASAR